MSRIKKTAVNGFLLFLSLTITVAAVLGLLRAGVRLYGLDIDEIASCLPRPEMWVEDPKLGYRNKPFLKKTVFGNIEGRTDRNGFRSAAHTTTKFNKSPLVVGIGDSVMWGNKVNLEDTFMGRLQQHLKTGGIAARTVNTGVVGYSTLQEKLFYEKDIAPLAPNIVLVNFCSNDWLPTEDPFNNLRKIHLDYLERELALNAGVYTTAEKKVLSRILQTFSRKGEQFWDLLATMHAEEQLEPVLRKVFLERPIRQMADAMKKNGTRLIYLFIPDTLPEDRERSSATASDLMEFMNREQISYIDFAPLLRDEDNCLASYRQEKTNPPGAAGSLSIPALVSSAFSGGLLAPYDPANNIRRISQFRRFSFRHHSCMYIDPIGHLSRKGHEVVAQRISFELSSPQ